jgi:hypothetical protein
VSDDTNDKAQEAAELAKSAGNDAADSGKKTLRAVQKGTGAAVEVAADELKDAGHKIEGTAEDALQAARKVDVNLLGKLSNDLGVGFLSLSVSIYAGAIAYAKFRQVARGRK